MTIRTRTKGGGAIAPFFNEPLQAADYVVGKYYPPSVNYAGNNIATCSANNLIFLPFVPFRTYTFDAICIYNGSAADSGSKLRLGVYNDSGNGYPGTLLVDAGEVTLDATTALREIVFSGGRTLTANTIYWLAFFADSGLSIRTMIDSASNNAGINSLPLASWGMSSVRAAGASGNFGALTQVIAYGTLPASANPSQLSITVIPEILMKG